MTLHLGLELILHLAIQNGEYEINLYIFFCVLFESRLFY